MNNSSTKRILRLTLSRQPFEVMVTGEKDLEFRKPSKWILSRLKNKDGSKREYDLVEFTNGYGRYCPRFLCEYLGYARYIGFNDEYEYSNGLIVQVEDDDVVISLGKVLEVYNWESIVNEKR